MIVKNRDLPECFKYVCHVCVQYKLSNTYSLECAYAFCDHSPEFAFELCSKQCRLILLVVFPDSVPITDLYESGEWPGTLLYHLMG